MITKRSIILNAATLGPSSTGAANGGIIDLTPWTDYSWAKEITFYITVSGINGSPTGGTLTAKFQLGNPNVSGNQFSTTSLFDLDTAQKATLIVEGEDWSSPVASYNSSFPVTTKRTLQNFGSIANLHLDASGLTGGTNPTFTISVTLVAVG